MMNNHNDVFFSLENIKSGYGNKEILHGISMFINRNEIVSLIGHNGAGKTTLLRTIFGLILIREGEIIYDGIPINSFSPNRLMMNGMVYVPQERNVFPTLTVMENIQLSNIVDIDNKKFSNRLNWIFNLFPILNSRKYQKAGTLSGGEQKMLAISMALMVEPKMILLDEPSLGLSPILVKKFMDTLKKLNSELMLTILLVEQNLRQALRIANRVYVMKNGSIVKEISGGEMKNQEELWKLL